MDRTCALAVVLGFLCAGGCASTRTTQTETRESERAEFQRDVRDYERIQKQQTARELASEGDKRTMESLGEPGQVETVVQPK